MNDVHGDLALVIDIPDGDLSKMYIEAYKPIDSFSETDIDVAYLSACDSSVTGIDFSSPVLLNTHDGSTCTCSSDSFCYRSCVAAPSSLYDSFMMSPDRFVPLVDEFAGSTSSPSLPTTSHMTTTASTPDEHVSFSTSFDRTVINNYDTNTLPISEQVSAFASRKYKPVAVKVRAIPAELPDEFRIVRAGRYTPSSDKSSSFHSYWSLHGTPSRACGCCPSWRVSLGRGTSSHACFHDGAEPRLRMGRL